MSAEIKKKNVGETEKHLWGHLLCTNWSVNFIPGACIINPFWTISVFVLTQASEK